MQYRLSKEIPKDIKIDKNLIVLFYNACKEHVDITCTNEKLNFVTSIEVNLANSGMKTVYNSFDGFNNDILNESVFDSILIMVMKIDPLDLDSQYSIIFHNHKLWSSLSVSASNKLWVDDTTSKFETFFDNLHVKKLLDENGSNPVKKPFYKEPMFIITVISLFVAIIGVIINAYTGFISIALKK